MWYKEFEYLYFDCTKNLKEILETMIDKQIFWSCKTLPGGLVVSESTSHVVGRGFAAQPGHTKDHHRDGTNCLPALHTCVRVGVWQCSQTV